MDQSAEFQRNLVGWMELVIESLLRVTVYCPRYQPIPYRSKKLVTMVSELA